MTGKFRVDTIESSTYGIIISEGSYENILQFPSLKKPDINNWDEEDGIEVNLNNPVVENKEISITFVSTSYVNIDNILYLFKTGAYHTFYFYDINMTKSLRFVRYDKRKGEYNKITEATLVFSEDNPEIINATPSSTLSSMYDNSIDNNLLSNYGVLILEGSYDELIQNPNPKKKLIIESETISGLSYPDNIVKNDAKDIKLNCLMLASTIEECKDNMNALLYLLTRPGLRTLYSFDIGTDNSFYYKSMQINKFTTYQRVKIWCEFSLNICLTNYQI